LGERDSGDFDGDGKKEITERTGLWTLRWTSYQEKKVHMPQEVQQASAKTPDSGW